MAEFRLEARTRAGTYLATLPYRNLQGEFWRNKPKQIRFELPLYHENITRANVAPGKTEVQLFRNNSKIFTGPLWNATASSSDAKLSCEAESIESYLGLRRISSDLQYTSMGRELIVWNLVSTAQTGTDAALGIIAGTLQVIPAFTIGYLKSDGEYYFDKIEELASSDVNGFDWEIDQNRALQVYYPRPQVASRVRLEWGGAISAYSVQVQGKWIANDIYVLGKDTLRSQPTIDTAKRLEYGLRQITESNTGLTMQSQVNEYAQYLRRLHRDAKEIPQIALRSTNVNPFEGDITVGQTAPVVISDGWVQYNQTMRCNGFQFTVGKQGEETFSLYMTDLREVT